MDEQALSEAEAELDAILAETPFDEPATSQTTQSDSSLFAHPEEDEELLFQDNPEEDKEEGYYTGSLISDDELSDSFKELDKPTHGPSQVQDLDDQEERKRDR